MARVDYMVCDHCKKEGNGFSGIAGKHEPDMISSSISIRIVRSVPYSGSDQMHNVVEAEPDLCGECIVSLEAAVVAAMDEWADASKGKKKGRR